MVQPILFWNMGPRITGWFFAPMPSLHKSALWWLLSLRIDKVSLDIMMDHGNRILSLLPLGVYRYTPSSSSINWPVEPVVWNCVLPALHLFFCCSHFIEKISEYKISNTTVIGQLDFTWFSSVQIKPSKPSGSLPQPIRTGCLLISDGSNNASFCVSKCSVCIVSHLRLNSESQLKLPSGFSHTAELQ